MKTDMKVLNFLNLSGFILWLNSFSLNEWATIATIFMVTGIGVLNWVKVFRDNKKKKE